MFALNKTSRAFIEKNHVRVRNGFINHGLIDCFFDRGFCSDTLIFNNYILLEKAYLEALDRIIENRIITIDINISD